MPTLRVFNIKFIHNSRKGAKVSITDTHYDERRIISYDHETGNTLDTALNWFKTAGISVLGTAIQEKMYCIITEDLSTRIKKS